MQAQIAALGIWKFIAAGNFRFINKSIRKAAVIYEKT